MGNEEAVLKRFWSKVNRKGPDECWEWIGTLKKPQGYGFFYICQENGIDRNMYAHRFIFQYLNGPVGTMQYVCHHCDNPKCVNPKHLFLGDAKANWDDMWAKKRHYHQTKPEPTHCKRGHAYTPENTFIQTKGKGKGCKECRRHKSRTRLSSLSTLFAGKLSIENMKKEIIWDTGDMIETPGNTGTRLYMVDSILIGALNQESILELSAVDKTRPSDVEGKSNAPIHVPVEMMEAAIRSGVFVHTKHD